MSASVYAVFPSQYRNHAKVGTGVRSILISFNVVFFIAPRCYLSDGCQPSDGGAEIQLYHAVLQFWRTPGAISPMDALLNRNTPRRTGATVLRTWDPICRTVLQRILAGLGNASRSTVHKTIRTYPPEKRTTTDSRPSHETGHVRDHAKDHVPYGSNWR